MPALNQLPTLLNKEAEMVNAFFKNVSVSALIFLGITILLLFIRRYPATWIAELLVARKKKHHPKEAKLAAGKLIPAIGWLLTALSLSITVELLPPLPRFNDIFDKLITSLLVAAIFYFLYKLTGLIWLWLKPNDQVEAASKKSARQYLGAALRIVILILGILSLLAVWIKNIAGVVAGLGIGGLAVALAAQDTLANFIGSLAIMFDHPFVLGDYISTPEFEGTVTRIGLRSSQLRRPDRTIIHVPNKKLADSVIANLSQRSERRVDNIFFIALDNEPSAIHAFMEELSEMIKNDEDVKNKEGCVVDIEQFTERAIAIRVRFFTAEDYNKMLIVSGRINKITLELAAKHGIRLPRIPFE